ncbi:MULTISPECIES: ABC transporter permease [unclassified Streptomyces]|jgi:fructose transport system permease protein|uniref:ABC transporter permease n=1 Tax=unclassified Streptomyces TaxID=2593676 RepID=UPI000F4FC8BA|nr:MULTISPECIES: ABC transporter permease [unclassified Streptomyces]MDH6452044.1 fructose transport system permease protein [Streptomyces sp. SAI-119]MDH6497403.1 fructose transport system permease protein [Streptomyces sp. SAI-149]QUC55884.1 ABC transporter permease [Streptomyces sp. A2-16]GLP67532.1 ABC transporter permease [Streptomyces sp. TUS-ST3]
MTATSTPPSTSSPYAELKAPTTARRLLTAPTTGPLVALLLACVFFAVSTDQFLTGGNFSLIVQQVMVVGTLAIGQTLIILTAGIDLSCGAVMAFGSIVIAKMAAEGSLPPLLAIALGLVVCGGFGLVNGLLVQKIPLPPFIVTLGMLNVAFALTHIYSEEQTVTNLPGPLTALGQTFPMGHTDITYGSLVTIALFLLLAYALSSTGWGRHVYALGNSQEAARLNGIRTSRLTIGVYTVAGLLYGVAALLLISRTGVGDPQAGQTDNLDSITAVVLGGTSLFGGRGSVLGTFIGVLIVGVFRNGLQLMGVASIYQTLITGVLVILAVTVDQISRKKAR